MKKITSLLIALTVCMLMQAQSQPLTPVINNKGKFGYTSSDGTLVIPYQFKEAHSFSNGVAKVRKGDKYGMIDEKGKTVIPFQYSLIFPYNKNIYKIAKGDKFGFMDYSGKILIKPEYDAVVNFANGMAYIKKSNKYGFINENFEIICEPKYTAIGKFDKNDICWINIGGNIKKNGTISGGKWGLMNRNCKEVVAPEWKGVGNFSFRNDKQQTITLNEKDSRELAKTNFMYMSAIGTSFEFDSFPFSISPYYWFSKSANGLHAGIVNTKGDVVIPHDTYDGFYVSTSDMIIVSKVNKKKQTLTIVNTTNNRTFQCQDGCAIYPYIDYLAMVKQDNSYYFIDKNGRKISKDYDKCCTFNEGVCSVEHNSKWGLIDKDGNEIVIPQYLDCGLIMSEGKIRMKNTDNKCGFIDKYNNTVIPFIYEGADDFKYGYAGVKGDEYMGLINEKNDTVISFNWDDLVCASAKNQNIYWVKKGSQYKAFAIDKQKLAFTNSYQGVLTNFENGRSFVMNDSLIGAVNESGTEIIPCVCYSEEEAASMRDYLDSNKLQKLETNDVRRRHLYYIRNLKNYSLNSKIKESEWDY